MSASVALASSCRLPPAPPLEPASKGEAGFGRLASGGWPHLAGFLSGTEKTESPLLSPLLHSFHLGSLASLVSSNLAVGVRPAPSSVQEKGLFSEQRQPLSFRSESPFSRSQSPPSEYFSIKLYSVYLDLTSAQLAAAKNEAGLESEGRLLDEQCYRLYKGGNQTRKGFPSRSRRALALGAGIPNHNTQARYERDTSEIGAQSHVSEACTSRLLQRQGTWK